MKNIIQNQEFHQNFIILIKPKLNLCLSLFVFNRFQIILKQSLISNFFLLHYCCRHLKMIPEDIELYRPLEIYPMKCVEEIKMLLMSQEIRNKPNWFEKVTDAEIAAKWKCEAVEQGLRSEAADYVIEEIKFLATVKDGCIEAGPIQGTWKADNLIDDTTNTRLKKLVAAGLENVPPEKKDYHPGSDNLVVDLVHPSLFCFVEDESILINEETIDEVFLPKSSEETPAKKVRINYNEIDAPSSKYRWLPSDVNVSAEGGISFDTYINNLHPIKQKELVGVIGEILEKFIPLFNRTLTDVINWKESIIKMTDWSWYGPDQFNFNEDGDDDEAYAEWEGNRPILPVPIPTFKKPDEPKKVVDLKSEKLQVIVKLANIELTPEKPKYNGGKWHIEGIEEERIVATGIYYYEMENITESKLSFRQSVDDPYYEQGDDRGVYQNYGLENGDALNQVLGSLIAIKERCVVFPNIYQHYVAPFKLADKTKPGFRKILVFFLVDPTVKIISTNNVLPQQPDWLDVQPDARAEKRKIMTLEEAKKWREQLMFQRKYARDEFQKEFYEREFSLCEH